MDHQERIASINALEVKAEAQPAKQRLRLAASANDARAAVAAGSVLSFFGDIDKQARVGL